MSRIQPSHKSRVQTTLESLKRKLDLDRSHNDSKREKGSLSHDHRLEDLEKSLKTPRLLSACEKGDLETVKRLFKQHNKLDLEYEDSYGRTALVYSSANGHLSVVRELLRKNANREHCCEGASPLYWAVSRGHTSVVNELLLYDANPDSTNEKGWTSLMNASYFGRTNIVKLLLTYGANVDIIRNDDGKSALHWACKNGRINIVKLLLQFGANPNLQDKNKKQTPLIYAIFGNYCNIVQILLSYATDPFIINIKSKSALDIAQEMSNEIENNNNENNNNNNNNKDAEGSSTLNKKKNKKFKKNKNLNKNEQDCDLVVLLQQAGRLYSGIQQIVNPSMFFL